MGLLKLIGKILFYDSLKEENKQLIRDIEKAEDDYSDLLHEYGILASKIAKIHLALEE